MMYALYVSFLHCLITFDNISAKTQLMNLNLWKNFFRLDPALIAVGNIYGTNTSARLTTDQMMDIARDRLTGDHPIRAGIQK